jgi:hypothetical protein
MALSSRPHPAFGPPFNDHLSPATATPPTFVTNPRHVIRYFQIPDDVDEIPLVDEAIASSAFVSNAIVEVSKGGGEPAIRGVLSSGGPAGPAADRSTRNSAHDSAAPTNRRQPPQGNRRESGGGRKTRWTPDQIEALVEGVEKHGLSAWRTIVQVGGGEWFGVRLHRVEGQLQQPAAGPLGSSANRWHTRCHLPPLTSPPRTPAWRGRTTCSARTSSATCA